MATDKPKEMENTKNETEDKGVGSNLEELDAFIEKAMRSMLQDKQPKRGDNSQAESGDTTKQGEFDVTKSPMRELEYLLECSDEQELVDLCEREIDRRIDAYDTWKDKNSPGGDEDYNEFPRPILPMNRQKLDNRLILSDITSSGSLFDILIKYSEEDWSIESVC